jgi:hypothetical protein
MLKKSTFANKRIAMKLICKNCIFVEEMHLVPKDLICMNPESDNYLGVVKPDETCKLIKTK